MTDNSKVQKFMSDKIKFQRNCFITYAWLKVPWDIWIPEKDTHNNLIFVNERWNITRDWCEYLLDEFSPEWERENLSWDQWYFRWYLDWMNDFLRFLNTLK